MGDWAEESYMSWSLVVVTGMSGTWSLIRSLYVLKHASIESSALTVVGKVIAFICSLSFS